MKAAMISAGLGLFVSVLLYAGDAGGQFRDYGELPDLSGPDADAWASVKGSVVHWGSTDVRYDRSLPAPPDGGRTISLTAWKGESVPVQLVVSTRDGLDSLTVAPGELRYGKNVIPASSVSVGFVRYVMTDELNKDGLGGCGYRRRADFDSSMVADVIDHLVKSMSVPACSTRPVWLTVDVPRDIPAGRYSGSVCVSAGGRLLTSLQLDVTVKDHVLPEKPSFHLDLWQNPYAVARYHGVEPFSREHLDLMRPVMERYARAGGKVITASIIHRPWNGQTYDPFSSMVTWIKRADGTWLFDFTVFDIWVEFMMSLGVDSQINCYSMVPWQLSFRYFDQASDSFRYFSAGPGEEEYAGFWTGMLRSFASHLKSKGWFDITMLAMDELPREPTLAAVEVVKNADPDFKIAFAGEYHEEFLELMDCYCIPLTEKYPSGTAARRRAEGKITTYYTCCSEPWPNTFTFSRPAEAEWIGWYIAANGLDGYLRWALNSWPEEPLKDSRFTAWAAGDTYLIYPCGRSSIRFERLRAGITAFEKVAVLRKVCSGDRKAMEQIDKALSAFVLPPPGERPDAALVVNAAKKVLDRY